jgi:hypothetical protein
MTLLRVLLLAITGFAICLWIAEFSVSRLLPEYSLEGQRSRVETAKQIVRWRPHRRFHHVGEGWRAMLFPKNMSAARTRVMIVGDSFVMGHGVGAEGRFGNVLIDEMKDRLAIAVLGTSSHSTVIYRNTIREALKRSDYDVALIFIDQTDPVDDWLYSPDLTHDAADWNFRLGHMMERYELLTEALSRLDREFGERSNVLHQSALFNLARPADLLEMISPASQHHEYIRRSLERRGEMVDQLLADPGSATSRAMIATTLDYARDLQRELSARDVRVLFVANPWKQHVGRRAGRNPGSEADLPLENRLELVLESEFAGVEGVDVLPFTEMFRAHKDPNRLFFDAKDDIHWNWIGHRYVASLLRDHFRAREISTTDQSR